MLRFVVACGVFLTLAGAAAAQEVWLTEDQRDLTITLALTGQTLTIDRRQDQGIDPALMQCPPFCLQPITVAADVRTLGEIEVLDFLRDSVAPGTGLLIDSRLPGFLDAGTIPGAVNVPFVTLEPDNPVRDDILRALGATGEAGQLRFDAAMSLVVFCDGPASDQSARAILALLDAGYPAEKLGHYRGGMFDWRGLGLRVTQVVDGG